MNDLALALDGTWWALASLVVQVTATLAVIFAVALACRRCRASTRHAVWLCGLCAVSLAPFVTLSLWCSGTTLIEIPWLAAEKPTVPNATVPNATVPSDPGSHVEPVDVPPVVRSAFERLDTEAEREMASFDGPIASATPNDDESSHQVSSPRVLPTRNGPWRLVCAAIVLIALLGTMVSCVRLGVGMAHVQSLLRGATDVSDQLSDVLVGVRGRLGMGTLPRVRSSPRVSGPVVVDALAPTVLLPPTLLDDLSDRQLEDVLVHECAHVIRGDLWIGLLQRLVGALLWWHPFVHVLNGRLSRVREEACDDFVLRDGDPPRYAEALLAVTQFVGPEPRSAGIGLLPVRWKLEDRVAGLLDRGRNTMTGTNRTLIGSLALGLAGLVVLVAGSRLVPAERPALANDVRNRAEADVIDETGDAKSDPTEDRRRLLKDDLDSFELVVKYAGRHLKPPYSLQIHLEGRELLRTVGGRFYVGLPRERLAKLVDDLAEQGFLRDAVGRAHEGFPDAELIRISNSKHAQFELHAAGKPTVERLTDLHALLDGEAASGLKRVLDQRRASRPRADEDDPTAARRTALESDLDTFELTVAYAGPQRKPYYSFQIHVEGRQLKRTVAGRYYIGLSKERLAKLVADLAEHGFLRNAHQGVHKGGIDGEVIAISNSKHAQFEILGRGKPTIERLTTLHTLLDGEAAKGLKSVLDQRRKGRPSVPGAKDDPTERRRQSLKQSLDTFELNLSFVGESAKPFYELHLHTRDREFEVENSTFFLHYQLTKEAAAKLVDGLAKEGFLRDAKPGEAKTGGDVGYVLRVSNASWAQNEVLGQTTDEWTRDRLVALRGLLEGEPRKGMQRLLARLVLDELNADPDEVSGANDGDDALKLSFRVLSKEWYGGDQIVFVCRMANVSKAPLVVPGWGHHSRIDIVDSRGNVLEWAGGRDGLKVPPFPIFQTIPAGESRSFMLTAIVKPGGHLDMEPLLGGFERWDLAKGDLFVRTTVDTSRTKDEYLERIEKARGIGPIWRGRVTSNAVKVRVDDAAFAVKETFPIRVGLALPDMKKFVYGPDEPIPVSVAKRNFGKERLTVWHSGFWPNHEFVAHYADGTDVPLTERGKLCKSVFGPDTPRDKNVPVDLEPNHLDGPAGPHDVREYFDIEPGRRIHVRCRYLHAGSGRPEYVWSNELILTIAAR